MQIHELNNYAGALNDAYMAVDDGSDTGKEKVKDITDPLNTRIDNIIAGGTAPSAAEVTDARLGADGVVYPSLGDAIRDQITNLNSDITQLDIADYLKIYSMTMADNRAVRFIPLAKVNDVITSAHIEFDYESTDDMHFGQWRIVLYGGSNTSGGVGTELYSTGSNVGYTPHISVDMTVSNSTSFDYAQFFIEFIYDTTNYADDIVLNNFHMSVNGIEKKIYGCNTWTYSHHSASYQWKSNLIPAYATKAEIPPTYPQLLVSIIDDDTNVIAPTIWGSILTDYPNVKIGFACPTGYMNGTFVGVDAMEQMTLAQLKTLYNNGHEVYSHGWGAYSVRPLSDADLSKECWKSKDWLFSNGFVRGAETIVYSGGANDDDNQHNIVRGYYKFGVNAWGGGINTNVLNNPLYINRTIGDTLTLAQLTAIVDSYITSGGLLVFGFHSYELNKDAANNIQKIKDLISYIQNGGANIVPFEQAVHSIYGMNV